MALRPDLTISLPFSKNSNELQVVGWVNFLGWRYLNSFPRQDTLEIAKERFVTVSNSRGVWESMFAID